MKSYGAPKAGVTISHIEIENEIKAKRSSHRYNAVVTAWRRKLYKDHNIVLGAVRGLGYKSLIPDERADFIGQKYKTGIRQVKRAASVAIRTETEGMSAESKRAVNHVRNTAAALILADATAAKALPPI